ncbi:MAG: alkaline phosphatase family protein, partial [Actinomycetota bacterium]|nr:alkaline phosphatase family protein [Actinomycetota bacterium]
SFTGYSEGLPDAGSAVCTAGSYARKHVPWTDFASLPSSVNQPFTAFPTNFATLPTVAFVIPNLDHDMHDGTVGQADTWIRQHLDRYATWARTHHSLLVITWDEDDRSENNRIPTFVVGANVPAKQVSNRLTSYSLLRALEDRYTLPRLGASASAPALSLP